MPNFEKAPAMTSYHALLATVITVAACLLFFVADRVLMRVARRSAGKPSIEASKIIAVPSAISTIVMTMEGELTTGLPGEVAVTFFFIATSTGMFTVCVAIAILFGRLGGPPDTVEANAGIWTGIAFGGSMIVIASFIAFAQLAPG